VLALVAIVIGTGRGQRHERLLRFAGAAGDGRRVKRPYVAVVVTVAAFALTLWLHHGSLATNSRTSCCFVTYWIPRSWRPDGGLVAPPRPARRHPSRQDRPPSPRLGRSGRHADRLRGRDTVHGHLALHRLCLVALAAVRDIAYLSASLYGGAVYAVLRRSITQVQP